MNETSARIRAEHKHSEEQKLRFVERIAAAWASVEGEEAEFAEGRKNCSEEHHSLYTDYMNDAREMVVRAGLFPIADLLALSAEGEIELTQLAECPDTLGEIENYITIRKGEIEVISGQLEADRTGTGKMRGYDWKKNASRALHFKKRSLVFAENLRLRLLGPADVQAALAEREELLSTIDELRSRADLLSKEAVAEKTSALLAQIANEKKKRIHHVDRANFQMQAAKDFMAERAPALLVDFYKEMVRASAEFDEDRALAQRERIEVTMKDDDEIVAA